jgi:hypothetical protein
MSVINKLDKCLQISRDLFFVLRGIWVLIIFHLLAIVAFIFLAQGTDVLLLILENSFQVGNPVALFFYSLVYAFGQSLLNFAVGCFYT